MTAKLTRAQKGRFVALCWIAQIYKHIADPKPSYVADWDDLPDGNGDRRRHLRAHRTRHIEEQLTPRTWGDLRNRDPRASEAGGGLGPGRPEGFAVIDVTRRVRRPIAAFQDALTLLPAGHERRRAEIHLDWPAPISVFATASRHGGTPAASLRPLPCAGRPPGPAWSTVSQVRNSSSEARTYRWFPGGSGAC